jgi:hypothetical protein
VRDVARLHAAVVAANATAGFFITSRSFTPEAEAYAATAPLKLVDGAKLVASIQRSMATWQCRKPIRPCADNAVISSHTASTALKPFHAETATR